MLDTVKPENAQALEAGVWLHDGRYQLCALLGQGGFGITYRAAAASGGFVAIKEFFPFGCSRVGLDVRPPAADSGEFSTASEKYFEEARTLARFDHPGIVRVHDVFREHNTSYMVMEYLEGQTLEAMVQTRHALPEAEAVGYIERAAQALEVVHEAGLLHRDIKPGNIMVCPDGRVVLIDFGTARAFETGQAQRHTIAITPGYAPLEQYAREARRGPYTDLYALAATLYHLLTGEAPVPATDRASGVELPDIRTLNPQVSRLAAWAVMEGLAMEVAKRPQSARRFLDRLDGKEGLVVPGASDPLQQLLDTLNTQPNWTPAPRPAPPPPTSEPELEAPLPPAPVHPPVPVDLVQTIKATIAPRSIALAPDGSWIANSYLGEIELWDTETGERLECLRDHWSFINSIAISPNGQFIASGDDKGAIRVWHRDTTRVRGAGTNRFGWPRKKERTWFSRPFNGHTWKVKSVAFSGDSTRLVSGSSDMSVRVWDVQTCETLRAMRVTTQRITTTALSRDGCLAASGGWEKVIHLWDTDTGRLVKTLHGHKHMLTALAFSPDGSLLVSAACDDMVRVWNTHSGREVGSFEPEGYVSSIAFSPDGNVIATGADIGMSNGGYRSSTTAGVLQLWDVATCTSRQILHRARINTSGDATVGMPTVTYSNDGRFIAGCCGSENYYTAHYYLLIWRSGAN